MNTPKFKHPPTPPAIPGDFAPLTGGDYPPAFVPDPTVEAAHREFDRGDNEEPAWALKPHETVCRDCWIVQPCDCEVAA